MKPGSPALVRTVAYGAVMLASSCLNNVFVTYYLALFTGSAALTPAWFYFGQTVFMLWNAVNDPLFGWFSDSYSAENKVSRRTHAIRVGGVAWAAAFALVWWPWGGSSSSISGGGGGGDQGSVNLSAVLAGLHFMLSLCFYDGMLTYTELNHSALLADMSNSDSERADANSAAAVGAAAGSATSLLAYMYWDAADLTKFRAFTLVLSVVCAGVFLASAAGLDAADGASGTGGGSGSGRHSWSSASGRPAQTSGGVLQIDDDDVEGQHGVRKRRRADEEHSEASPLPSSASAASGVAIAIGEPGAASAAAQPCVGGARPCVAQTDIVSQHTSSATGSAAAANSSGSSSASMPQYGVFLTQLISHHNFLVCVALSAVQVFDCTFEKNFFAPFMDVLVLEGHSTAAAASQPLLLGVLPSQPPLSIRGSVISLSFFLPHLITVALTPAIRTAGLKRVLSGVFTARLLLIGAAVLLGRASPWVTLLFMLLNRVSSESVCRLSPLVLSDVVDEDTYLHARRPGASLAASIVGAAAFVSKFSQSLAPMLGYALLPAQIATGTPAGAATPADASPITTSSGSSSTSSSSVVWTLLLLIPAATVLCQTVLWRGYTLHGAHLKAVKEHNEHMASAASGEEAATAAAGMRGRWSAVEREAATATAEAEAAAGRADDAHV